MIDIFTVIDTPDGWQPPPPVVHHDPLGGYGYTPDPVIHSAVSRAHEASQLSQVRRDSAARYLADQCIEVDVPTAVREDAVDHYRGAAAAGAYADAVYDVECALRWPEKYAHLVAGEVPA